MADKSICLIAIKRIYLMNQTAVRCNRLTEKLNWNRWLNRVNAKVSNWKWWSLLLASIPVPFNRKLHEIDLFQEKILHVEYQSCLVVGVGLRWWLQRWDWCCSEISDWGCRDKPTTESGNLIKHSLVPDLRLDALGGLLKLFIRYSYRYIISKLIVNINLKHPLKLKIW